MNIDERKRAAVFPAGNICRFFFSAGISKEVPAFSFSGEE